MASVLRYGAGSAIQFDLPGDTLVANLDGPRGTPVADVRAAVAEALGSPLNFPPLAQTIIPGDRIVLTLAEALPQAAAIVAAVIESIFEAGGAASQLTVLVGGWAAGDPQQLVSQVPAAAARDVTVVLHDPEDRKQLSYLATSSENKAIYVNRVIFDADMILPIGAFHLEDTPGYFGVRAGIFPAFSDARSQERYRSPAACASPVQRERLCRQADEVSWLLGVLFTLQVVPGAGGDILHVLGGEPDAVIKRGRALCREAWSYEVPRRASLVVVGIDGDSAQQTWDNVGRALAAARGAVAEEGAIALCTDLEVRPGPAMQQLAAADDVDRALREIGKQRLADAVPTAELARALEHVKVYLLSRLDEAVVEDLGIAPVTAAEQISRLAERHSSCILLGNGQHALATAKD